VLAGSLQEEEEGVTPNVEARVIHIQKAVDPPGNARADSEIICDLARRLARLSHLDGIFDRRARKFLLPSTSALRESAKTG